MVNDTTQSELLHNLLSLLAKSAETDRERDILWRSNKTGGCEMLRPNLHSEIPEETVKVAKAAFPNGNMYLNLRDTLGVIFADETFQELYPTLGHPAESPGRLALVTVM